jgi:hypothetical protein
MPTQKENIVNYIQKNGQATVLDLLDFLDIERPMIHRHLKELIGDGVLRKVGSAPKVLYLLAEAKAVSVSNEAAFDDTTRKIIEENFLLITPQGEKREGVSGFAQWCADRGADTAKKASEYVSVYKKYATLKKNGLLNGTEKIRGTFDNDQCIDRVYYIDFYAWEIFGKTKLGQLLLYAKQSQDQKMIKERLFRNLYG